MGFGIDTSKGLIELFRKQREMKDHHSDTVYVPSETAPVEEKLKSRHFETEKVLTYGQNYFAHDFRRKEIFAQSAKQPDGIFIHYDDIVSFELADDSSVLFSPSHGCWTLPGNTSGEKCKSLILKIITNDRANPEILLPFITLLTEKKSFVYETAFGIAKEIAEELGGIVKA